MLKIQSGDYFIFAGSVSEGSGRPQHGGEGAEALLEAAASYMEERGGALAVAAYKDEIKYELTKRMREALYEQAQKDGTEITQYETDFLAVLFLPEENKVVHIGMGKGAFLGMSNQGHIGTINMSWERIKNRSIVTDGAAQYMRMGVSSVAEYKSFYLLEDRADRFILSGGLREAPADNSEKTAGLKEKSIVLDDRRVLFCYYW